MERGDRVEDRGNRWERGREGKERETKKEDRKEGGRGREKGIKYNSLGDNGVNLRKLVSAGHEVSERLETFAH